MIDTKPLENAIAEYHKVHREAYENEISGKFGNGYNLHEKVRQAGYIVVYESEKLITAINKEEPQCRVMS